MYAFLIPFLIPSAQFDSIKAQAAPILSGRDCDCDRIRKVACDGIAVLGRRDGARDGDGLIGILRNGRGLGRIAHRVA